MNRTARMAQLRETIARRALATTGTPASTRILQIVRTGSVLTVATHQPDQRTPYCVDSYRLPAPDDSDLGFEGDAPLRWTLVEERGGAGADELPGMVAQAVTYAHRIA